MIAQFLIYTFYSRYETSDLQTETVSNETGKFATKHEERLLHHDKVEAIQLLDNSELVRRLKKTSFELL